MESYFPAALSERRCMKVLYVIMVSVILWGGAVAFSADAAEEQAVPTFAEAVIILTKYSGMFDQYVKKDASLSECVSFLNRKGIYVGLMEVSNGTEFTLLDCARLMGQARLLHTGEAEFEMGKVKLPKGIDSWKDFCIMNNVQYVQGYEFILKGLVAVR